MRLNRRPHRPRPDPQPARDAIAVHHRDLIPTGLPTARQARRARSRSRSGLAGKPPTSPHTAVRRPTWWRRLVVIAALVALTTVFTSAAPAQAAQVLAQAQSVDAVLSNLRGWLIGILASLATVFGTIGGVRYVMANGDPGELEKAKTAFRGAGVGYALAALAPLVVTVLQGILGV
jgi:hypothetical protein